MNDHFLSAEELMFHERTYQIVEIDFFNAIKALLPKELKPRDIYLIQTIKKDIKKQENTMSKIAEDIMMTPSKLSNNIDFLEKNGFLKRTKSPEDKRRIYVELTEKGESSYHHIQKFIGDTIKYTLKKLGLAKTLKLYGIVNKITSQNKNTERKKLNYKKFIENLISVYFIAVSSEDKLLEKKEANLTGHDLKILTYIYLNRDQDMTINQLSSLFEDPYTTVASAVQTMEEKHLIIKKPAASDMRKKILDLTDNGNLVVCEHLKSRKKIFDDLLEMLNEKEAKILYDAYAYVKEYANK